MKALIVAHPDDEIIWFTPLVFDVIIIAFMGRHDKPYTRLCRERAVSEHPLREKIILLNIDESGYWKDKHRIQEHQVARKKLVNSLLKIKKQYLFDQIFTHNYKGEYGHDDHILVHKTVTSLFSSTEIFCPTVTGDNVHQPTTITLSNNLVFYRLAKEIYSKNKAWTWSNEYEPPPKLFYSLHR